MARTIEQILEEVIGDKQLPIEKSTRSYVESLNLTDMHKLALAEMCYRMARKLDRDAGMATAAIAKELRETLAIISGDKKDDSDDFWNHFESGLSTKVRDQKKP